MATKKMDVKAEFRRLLAPGIIRALRNDARGRIPLKAVQRRQLRQMLRIAMTEEEIRVALRVRRTR